MEAKTDQVVNTALAASGTVVAVTPALQFYETPEWLGTAAVLGMTAIIIALIRGIYGLRRDMKWNGKERRK